MPMVCPQCNRSFGQHISCPECGGRLLFQAGMTTDDSSFADAARWQQTPWGRMAVGLVLAQGLAYGLQQFLTAGFLATGEEASVWTTLGGMILFQCLQGVCLLIGGALCGAGRQRGILYGSLIGLASGLILLIWQKPGSTVSTEIAIYVQPILHLAFGALGGFIGTLIWKPIPLLQLVEPTGGNRSVTIAAPTLPFLAGPLHLGHVCLGVFVVVNGVVWSNAILNWVINASQGSIEIRTHLQAQLIGWEVCRPGQLHRRRTRGIQHLQRPQARPLRRRRLQPHPDRRLLRQSQERPGKLPPHHHRRHRPNHHRRLVRRPTLSTVASRATAQTDSDGLTNISASGGR